jgi:hypothetical protein
VGLTDDREFKFKKVEWPILAQKCITGFKSYCGASHMDMVITYAHLSLHKERTIDGALLNILKALTSAAKLEGFHGTNMNEYNSNERK